METRNQEFIRFFNEAFAAQDIATISENVTDDVVWKMSGDEVIKGKQEVINVLTSMNDNSSYSLTIENIITHGNMAAANGVMEVKSPSGEVKAYEFCDIYKLNKHKDGKVKEMTSYVIEAKGNDD